MVAKLGSPPIALANSVSVSSALAKPGPAMDAIPELT